MSETCPRCYGSGWYAPKDQRCEMQCDCAPTQGAEPGDKRGKVEPTIVDAETFDRLVAEPGLVPPIPSNSEPGEMHEADLADARRVLLHVSGSESGHRLSPREVVALQRLYDAATSFRSKVRSLREALAEEHRMRWAHCAALESTRDARDRAIEERDAERKRLDWLEAQRDPVDEWVHEGQVYPSLRALIDAALTGESSRTTTTPEGE